MEDRLEVGRFSCSVGDEGRLQVLVVAERTIEYSAPTLVSRLVLAAPVTWDQSWPASGSARFRMALFDSAGELVDSVEQRFGARIGPDDPAANELTLELYPWDLDLVAPRPGERGHSGIDVSYVLRIAAEIDDLSRDRTGQPGAPLSEEREIQVAIRLARRPAILTWIESSPIVPLGERHFVRGRCQNISDTAVNGVGVRLWEEQESGDWVDVSGAVDLGTVQPGETKSFASEPRIHRWDWFTGTNDSFQMTGPFTQVVRYRADITVGDELVSTSVDPYYSLARHVPPGGELDKVSAGFIFFTLGMMSPGLWAALGAAYLVSWLFPNAVEEAWQAIRDYEQSMQRLIAIINDPIEPDDAYREPYRPTIGPARPAERSLRQTFGDDLASVMALSASMQVTGRRFLTALKMEDRASGRMQAEHAESLLRDLEAAFVDLHRVRSQLVAQDIEAAAAAGEAAARSRAVAELTTRNLEEGERERLREQGLDDEAIARVEDGLRRTDADQLADPHPGVEQLCAVAAQAFADALRIVGNIRRVGELRREEQFAELVSLALLTPDEYERHRDRGDLRSSYALSELCEISGATARKLDRVGIRTTTDLLTWARTSADRSGLATGLGISRKRLTSLVQQADLQRVPGVGDSNVRALRLAGIDSTETLKATEPRTLQRRLDGTRGRMRGRKLGSSELKRIVEAAATVEGVDLEN